MLSCDNPKIKIKPETKQEENTLKNDAMNLQKITPCLWVESDAKAVAEYYLSIFKDGELLEFHTYQNPPEVKEMGGAEVLKLQKSALQGWK